MTDPTSWARDAVRRLIRTEVRKLVIIRDRQSRAFAEWLRKTNDPAAPLGERAPFAPHPLDDLFPADGSAPKTPPPEDGGRPPD